ncbi:hypothetical protein ACFZDK_38640 [Streptomyces sp. NPDC007901]|uniref:hypothetical protein n=1 Tax=Streptomyces sp. NPDC007901 TaxID=3364785 RepID=UPI0036E871E9
MEQSEVLAGPDVPGTAASVMRKLPEVTLAFWIMKIAATTFGETAGDPFSQTLKLGYSPSSSGPAATTRSSTGRSS